jgi:cytidyltransferase-like protein
MVTVCISGYFDPIHKGHLEYIRKSRALGDKLIAIINNDKQSVLKKNSFFLGETDRAEIVGSLDLVDEVVISIDETKDVCKTLRLVNPDIFCNGGDQFNDQIPEKVVCNELGIELVDNLGSKIESSRWLIKRANSNIFDREWLGNVYKRQWGFYDRLLPSDKDYQVKKLVVEPLKKTSLQVHQKRSETWIVVSGSGEATIGDDTKIKLKTDTHVYVPIRVIHQIRNTDKSENLVLIEVQIGSYLGEDDITRFEECSL